MRGVGAGVLVLAACTILAGNGGAEPMKQKHSARYLTVRKLERGLKTLCREGAGGCALRNQWWTIEDVGHQTGISPGFMVGASFTESSGGDAACSGNPRNIWGLGSCDRYWTVPFFASWRAAFTYYARFIRSRWPRAETAWQLDGYCECGTAAWGDRTSSFMARLGFGGGRIAYP